MNGPQLRISRVHFPVTALGPGRRVGLWMQGCGLACSGCVSKDTWDPLGGQLVGAAPLVDQLVVLGADADGVTISGGEPFDQPDGLRAVLTGLRARLPRADVLVYSGYALPRLRRANPDLLDLIDALIPGRFIQDRPAGGAWRGSDNQPLVLLTPRAQKRYRQVPEQAPMQVAATDGGLQLIGVPMRGALEDMERRLAAAGIKLAGQSWQ